jgi:hypothetical protein
MERADNVRDVMMVQREITNIAQQKEAQLARAERLSKNSQMSRVNVYLEEGDPEGRDRDERVAWSVFSPVQRALKTLQNITHVIVDKGIFLVVLLVPISIGLVLVTAGMRRTCCKA